MKHTLSLLCLTILAFTLAGCGNSYDIPEIDREESAQHEAEITKQMEAEMERQMSGKK